MPLTKHPEGSLLPSPIPPPSAPGMSPTCKGHPCPWAGVGAYVCPCAVRVGACLCDRCVYLDLHVCGPVCVYEHVCVCLCVYLYV